MKRRAMISLMILSFLMIIFLPAASSVAEGGLLPSLTETVGIAMPSLGEALRRYPDEEMENGDGSITELYTNVSESDFDAFSVYLQQQEAKLADYKVEKGVLIAEIKAKDATFSLNYDTKNGEAEVTYPSGTFDEWVKNAKNHFATAQELLAERKTDEAYAEFFAIPIFMKYGPVDSLIKEDKKLAAAATDAIAARDAKYAPYRKVGNVVTFGTYPQTKRGTDQTPIEWIILDYDETNQKALLLSKYGLDSVPFHTKDEYASRFWEKCTLRTWLNDEFLKKAFSAKEQSVILVTDVENSLEQGYSEWDTNGWHFTNTKDQIFLLSYAEANHYLGVKDGDINNMISRVAPTEYALAQGADTFIVDKTEDGKTAGWWWLRSPGPKRGYAADVSNRGELSCANTRSSQKVVRPAFWLNLNPDFLESVIK